MIVASCRPFSGNSDTLDTAKRPGLELDKKLNPELYRLHESVNKDRHKIYAHSDSDVMSLEISVASYQGNPLAVPISRNPYVLYTKDRLENFNVLAKTVRSLIFDSVLEIQKQLDIGKAF